MRRKRNKLILLIVMLLCVISIGFAYLSTNLTINGAADVSANTWDVHFENVIVDSGSVIGTQVVTEPTLNTNTSTSFEVSLNNPGEYYKFTIDVVNKGSIDAMIDSINTGSLTDTQKKYLEYSVTYDDGEEIKAKDLLENTTGKETLLVSIKYKDDLEASDLPSSGDSLTFNISLTYVQADDSAKSRGTSAYTIASSIGTKYTGATDGIGSYDIYINSIENANDNVSFGGFCWKIIRTTETGGTKLLYNGVVSDTGTCENTGASTSLHALSFNNDNVSLSHLGYMYNASYDRNYKSFYKDTNDYIFGNDITYSGGTYTLTPTNAANITINGVNWSTSYNAINNNHYTCLSSGTTCTSVYYVYFTDSSSASYIQLDNGKKVGDVIDEMLGTNGTDVNLSDSNIKIAIDTWFSSNLNLYSDYLEDTVFCNDRSISNLNGWNPNGGSTISSIEFKSFSSNEDLSYGNKNDRFTISTGDGNGKLTYKVGLMSSTEANLMSISSRTSGQCYWLLSPSDFYSSYNRIRYVDSSGNIGNGFISYNYYLRPSISLKKTDIFSSGDGSSTNPYVVMTN